MKKQMHRLLSLMLSLILVVGMIPGTMTAHAAEDMFTVTATASPAEGGTITGAGEYQYNSTPTLTAIPARGYKFSGWYKAETDEFAWSNKTMRVHVDGNLSYIAKFDKVPGNLYDVTFEGEHYTYDAELWAADSELYAADLTPDVGYVLDKSCVKVYIGGNETQYGWSLLGNEAFRLDATYITGDIRIVVTPKVDPALGYAVTFDANGGNAVTPSSVKTDPDGKLTTLPKATHTVLYMEFDGWYTSKEGGEKVTTSTVFTQDTTIYAHWNEKPFIVQVIGGTSDKHDAKVGETVTITAGTPEPGKKFAGWTTESGVEFADASAATTTFVMPAKDVRVDAQWVNDDSVIYDVSNATHDGKDKAIFGKDFVVKFTPDEGYKMTVEQMVVKVGGVTQEMGDDWTFDTETNTLTIKAAAVDGYITIEAHAEKIPNTYTVTLPTGTGFTSAAAATYESLEVVEGKEFRFVVSITDGYRATSAFKVKANGVELTKDGTGYVINNITADQVITVEGVEALPEYTVTLPTGTGFTSAAAATYESLKVVEGKDFRFVVSIVDGYRATADFKVKANGVELTKDGTGYVISNITADQVITVEGVEALPKYTITLPNGNGVTAAPAATYTTSVVEGKDFRFVVSIVDGYRATADFKVKANGVEVTKDGDIYVIPSVTENITITVEGVEALPEYTVTLPTGTGFTSAASATYESLKVVEGKDFRFVVSIVDGYRATADFKVKANGVELTKDGTGYVINNITADQVITVEGVEKIPAGDTSDTPQTGDNSMIWLLIALLFVIGAGVVATTVFWKKRFSVK